MDVPCIVLAVLLLGPQDVAVAVRAVCGGAVHQQVRASQRARSVGDSSTDTRHVQDVTHVLSSAQSLTAQNKTQVFFNEKMLTQHINTSPTLNTSHILPQQSSARQS